MKNDYIERSYYTVSKAIYILSHHFDNIAVPIRSCYFYDLLAEKDFCHYRIKVISTTCKAPSGHFVANLRKSGGGYKGNRVDQSFDSKNCNFIYIETPKHCYLIPSLDVCLKRSLTLNGYEKYIISG